MTYADIHARDLARAGWSYGFTSHLTRDGRRMVAADAHKDGVRFVVHANSLRMGFRSSNLRRWFASERTNAAAGIVILACCPTISPSRPTLTCCPNWELMDRVSISPQLEIGPTPG